MPYRETQVAFLSTRAFGAHKATFIPECTECRTGLFFSSNITIFKHESSRILKGRGLREVSELQRGQRREEGYSKKEHLSSLLLNKEAQHNLPHSAGGSRR